MIQRLICLVSLLLIVAGIPVSAETLLGRVVGVGDGDTLTLLTPTKQLSGLHGLVGHLINLIN